MNKILERAKKDLTNKEAWITAILVFLILYILFYWVGNYADGCCHDLNCEKIKRGSEAIAEREGGIICCSSMCLYRCNQYLEEEGIEVFDCRTICPVDGRC